MWQDALPTTGFELNMQQLMSCYILKQSKVFYLHTTHQGTKYQIELAADWWVVESPKKRTNEFVYFAVKSKKVMKNNKFLPPICLGFLSDP